MVSYCRILGLEYSYITSHSKVQSSLNLFISESGQNVSIRSCAVDAGTLTADTEIVRMSHCGTFYLDDRYIADQSFRQM